MMMLAHLLGMRRGRIRNVGFIAIAGVALLTSCQTTNPFSHESRVDRHLRKHPALSADVRQGLESGQLVKGMTPAEVKLCWGSPARRESSGQGGVHAETWVYEEALSSDDRGPASTLYALTIPIGTATFKGKGRSMVLEEWIDYTEKKPSTPPATPSTPSTPSAPSAAAAPPAAAPIPAAARIRTTPGADIAQWPSLSVTGVAVSGGRRYAFINNTAVTPGELIGGVTLLDVTEDGVYLRYGEETVFLGKGRSTGTASKGKSAKRKLPLW